ncbi:MAG: AEC family transporter [Lachnospiraceae bacterium]|nr:AEC family transporter [Lachnospiraceae bacterium]
MESFYLALSVVVPMLIYMLTGGIITRLGIFKPDQFRALNTMLFKVFIPLSLFFNVYSVDLRTVIVPDIFLFCALGVIVVLFLALFATRNLVKDRIDQATLVQGIYRSNFVLFGLTIAQSLCDEDGVALVSALSAVVIPLFNMLAVILFELSKGGKVKLKKLIISIFKNPLVDAGLIAGALSLMRVHFPALLESPLKTLGGIATPVALVALGGILSFESVVAHRKLLVIGVLGRLVAVPCLMLAAGILMGFRGNELIAIMAVFGSPTAVASAPMAQAMGGNGDLAGEIVVMTSVFCLFSIFLYTFLMSSFGLI